MENNAIAKQLSYGRKFAVEMRLARENKGITQKELAERCGISINTIGLYEKTESGGRIPALHIAILIARELDMSLDNIFELNKLDEQIKYFGEFISLYERLLRSGALTPSLDKTQNDLMGARIYFEPPFREFEAKCADMLQLWRAGTIDDELFKLWFSNEVEKYKKTDICQAVGIYINQKVNNINNK